MDLATAAERNGLRAEARTALERHVALMAGAPAPTGITRRLGDLSLATGDTPAAVRWWRRAAVNTTDVALLVQLADAELRSGDPDTARQTVARALALAPADPGARRVQEALRH